MITAQANRLIDNWIDKGEVEFVTEFAAPLPQAVISTILGFPLEDMPTTKKWEEAQVRRFVYGFGPKSQMEDPDEADNARALVAFNRYIQEQIDEKRRNPKEDMITFLTNVEFQGKPLGDGDIISVVSGMHIGGNETTQYALTSEAMLLAQHPEIVEEMRADRSKVRFFVEEALRLYAPTQGLSGRVVARDTEIHGVKIPAGSLLHLRWAAANRDPDLCEAPDEIRLDRKNPGKHLTFSIRPRGCPGAGLSPPRAEHRGGRDAGPHRRDQAGDSEERLPAPAGDHAGAVRAEPGVHEGAGGSRGRVGSGPTGGRRAWDGSRAGRGRAARA